MNLFEAFEGHFAISLACGYCGLHLLENCYPSVVIFILTIRIVIMGLDYTCIHDDDDGLDKYVDPPRVELIIDGEAHRHSALPFFKFSDAKTEIVKLNSLANFSFVAKALYPLKDKYRTDADDAIALIEPVSSLKTWLKNNKDPVFGSTTMIDLNAF